ncbi:outer membrane beta-barrel protein [Pasteurella canis]|uniref:outer membrane beta-barrel protein n=1 Tax=Pasteurella canis TaxID=753 RepID=UPI001323FBBE|nr:outer membrane beta-barrel protein [Pasteurella canis]MXN88759.1 outer membrane beta-barrel protein [Pasteurella canis]
MKNQTLLLITLSLASVFATAQTNQINFYGKAGVDLTSRFETMKIQAENGSEFPAAAGTKKNTFSPSIFLETTYNVLPQTEIGLGIGYIKRDGFHYSGTFEERPGMFDKETYKINRYSSLPLYFIFKQNYVLNPDTKFYFKSDLGYALNKTKSTWYTSYTNDRKTFEHPIHFKTKDGLYAGLGVGIEYKFLLAELGYYHTNSALTYQSNHRQQKPKDFHNSYNNDALRLSVGFKF